jgi:hypothetical protein
MSRSIKTMSFIRLPIKCMSFKTSPWSHLSAQPALTQKQPYSILYSLKLWLLIFYEDL